MTLEAPALFFSYANPDQGRVLPFFEYLESQGFNVWIDCRELKPGQNWDFEVKRALDKATFVIAFISENSFDRRGYVQRELKLALDKLTEKLVDDIYIIPVLLDDRVSIPDQLRKIQCIRASSSDCNERIVDALRHQLERLGLERTEKQEQQGISWHSQVYKEVWDGIPGYEVELQYLRFQSDRYPNVSEIGDFIRGWLMGSLFEHRTSKLCPLPEVFNYGQERFLRTSTYDAHCEEPRVIGKVVSIQYNVYWYGAGAAHGNHHFKTYNFLLDPLILIRDLFDLFREPKTAFPSLQADVRARLCEIRVGDEPNEWDSKLEKTWIDAGTEKWEDFSAFTFNADGLEILFAPYQIAAYAFGAHSAKIPYRTIAPLMLDEYVSAMNLERFKKEVHI